MPITAGARLRDDLAYTVSSGTLNSTIPYHHCGNQTETSHRTSSKRRDIIEKASTICCVVPLIVTIRSGHDASDMLMRAPLYTTSQSATTSPTTSCPRDVHAYSLTVISLPATA